jgi:hypothetical protein
VPSLTPLVETSRTLDPLHNLDPVPETIVAGQYPGPALYPGPQTCGLLVLASTTRLASAGGGAIYPYLGDVIPAVGLFLTPGAVGSLTLTPLGEA